jgi:thiamine pyrophosphate-dependent acetolactate synthase large subunit-like protein
VIKGNPRQIKILAQAIQEAKKPLLYAGGGIISSGASAELEQLLAKTNIPIVITLMGLGCISNEHPLFLGMPGMHGRAAAMGAALGCPEHMVINISGDGGIQMNIQELATCAINKIPVKIVVLNNSYLGMVRQWQELFWNGNYSKTCLRQGPDCPPMCKGPGNDCPQIYLPDLVKVAEANGIKCLRAVKPGEVDTVLKEGFKTEGPVLMEFCVRKVENVYPMVPPGKRGRPA